MHLLRVTMISPDINIPDVDRGSGDISQQNEDDTGLKLIPPASRYHVLGNVNPDSRLGSRGSSPGFEDIFTQF